MNKKYIFLIIGIIVAVVVLSLFLLLGNENKKELVLKDNKTGYTTIFKYPKSQTFEITDEDQEGGKFAEIIVKNEANNIELEMYYYEESKNLYNTIKEDRKEDEGYKEYKWNNYEGYIYNVDDESLYFSILLQDETEESDAICLFGSVDAIDYNEANTPEAFDSEEFQNFMKSIEFKIEK